MPAIAALSRARPLCRPRASDEIYALSVFKPGATFTSAVTLAQQLVAPASAAANGASNGHGSSNGSAAAGSGNGAAAAAGAGDGPAPAGEGGAAGSLPAAADGQQLYSQVRERSLRRRGAACSCRSYISCGAHSLRLPSGCLPTALADPSPHPHSMPPSSAPPTGAGQQLRAPGVRAVQGLVRLRPARGPALLAQRAPAHGEAGGVGGGAGCRRGVRAVSSPASRRAGAGCRPGRRCLGLRAHGKAAAHKTARAPLSLMQALNCVAAFSSCSNFTQWALAQARSLPCRCRRAGRAAAQSTGVHAGEQLQGTGRAT